MSFQAGTRLGPYEIISQLGAGGMGEVFRARDTRLGRDVALKVLPDRFASDPDHIARFLRDAHLAKRQEALVAPEDRGIEMRSHFSNLPPLVV